MSKVVVLGNGIDWLDYCYENVQENVVFINNRIPMSSNNKFINYIIKAYFSVRDKNRDVILLPFRKIFYKYSDFRKFVNKDEKIKLLIYDQNRLSVDKEYLKWLRKKYKNINISYVFTNIVEKSGAKRYNFVDELNKYYDNVFAFDINDSKKYNFNYNYLIYEPKIVPNEDIKYDLFFVGGAKERLNKLHEVYNKAKQMGLKVCFYINGVDEKDQLKNSDIVYNKRISYKDSLQLLRESKCMVDFLQEGSEGIVLRICEAITWNKLIITDNEKLKLEKFYNEDTMLIVNDVNQITEEFINRPCNNGDNAKFFRFKDLLLKIKDN